jgi:hypothetical protein
MADIAGSGDSVRYEVLRTFKLWHTDTKPITYKSSLFPNNPIRSFPLTLKTPYTNYPFTPIA